MTHELDLARQIESFQALLSEIQREAIANLSAPPSRLSAAIMAAEVVLEELQVVVEAMRQQNEALLDAHHHLANERQRYQNLFDFAPDAYLMTDAWGNIEAINGAAATRLLNVPADYTVGKPLTVYIAEADHAAFFEQLNRLRSPLPGPVLPPVAAFDPTVSSLEQGQEFLIVPYKRSPLPMALSMAAERDRQGRVLHLYWLLRDISDRQRLELALQTSEARLSYILDSANAAIASFRLLRDKTWQYDYFSAGCEQVFGYTPAEFMADPGLLLSQVEDDLDALLIPFMEDIMAGGAPTVEYRFRHKDGSLRWIASTHTAQPLGEGGWQITAINQDVTDRKQLELALQASEAKLSGILNSAIAAISSFRVYANGDFEYEYWSAGCEQLFGYSLDHYDDKQFWLAQVHPVDREQTLMPLFEVFYAEHKATVEYRFRCQDGSLHWFSSSYNSRKIADDCWFVTTVNHDITDRKRAEADLQASERKLRAAFNGTFAFMGLLTPEGILLDANRAALAAIAVDLDAVVGQPFWQTPWWAHFPEQQRQLQVLVRRAANGETIQLETQHVWADGTQAWLDFSLKPIVDEAGQVVMLMPEGRDITERKQATLTLQRQIQQEYLLNDINEDIRQSLDLEAVLARAVERSRAVLESDRVIVFRLMDNGEGKVIAESVGNGFVSILGSVIPGPCFGDRYAEAYRQGQVGGIDDLEQADLAPCHANLLLQFQVRANLVVPILHSESAPETVPSETDPSHGHSNQNNQLWGLLIAHQCAAPRQWQPAEIALLKRIANQTSVAIQQSGLYGQVLQELQERERIQQVLQASEARFRALNATAPIGIVQIDADGHCVYTNARWQRVSGLSPEASLGKGWLQVVHPDDQPDLALAWKEYLAGRRQHLPQFRLLTPTGNLRWVKVALAPLRTATGDINGYVGTVEDITQRKEAERQLRQQAALLDIASDAIFVRDLDHRLLYWNRGAERLYGWSAAEALDCPVHDLLRGDLPQWNAIMQTLYAKGEWRGELQNVTKTGQVVTVSARWTLVPDEAGQPRFILSVETDITKKKALEAQFYQAQRLESLGRLSSGIAHDLNNVFTPILTMAQLLRCTQTGLSGNAQEQLRLLEDSAKRGISMVQQILSITRPSSGGRTEVDLLPLLQDLSSMLEQSLPRQITLRQVGFEPGTVLPRVSVDPTHLHQVLMNLCVNARDAMAEGGTLTITAEPVAIDAATVAINLDAQVGQYLRLTVADTGTGIDPAVRDRIFDPFFTTKDQGQGTGLGLAIVLGIVKSCGGFVQVESQIGQGTQMQVYLPALSTAQSDRPQALRSAETFPQPGQGDVILLVDDDDAVRQAVRSLLLNHNYRPLIASNGLEALTLYAQHRPTLVVLDIMMSGMDGLTLIQHLMASQPDVMIVATSGLATYQSAALAAGARVFLPKPYDFRDLLKTLADLLR
jgi:PAS domain S-box-containing protein